VVDDNADAGLMMTELLRAHGHEVELATDPIAALRVAEALRPEIAFLDIGLPLMDGHELGRRLRERMGPSIRLVAVTGYGQEQDLSRSRAAGFNDHLVKPVDARRLLSTLADDDGH
jgi:CheY-like chemotaxis protein